MAVILTLSVSPAHAERPLAGYKGADAGRLVLSLSAENSAQQYTLFILYRREGDKRSDAVGYDFVRGLAGHKPDFGQDAFHKTRLLNPQMLAVAADDDLKHVSEGMVLVTALAPGSYEIFNVNQTVQKGTMIWKYNLKSEVSLKFEIKPGKATYIGEFKALPLTTPGLFGDQKPRWFFGGRNAEGVHFVVTDQGARDLPIAIQKDPSLGEVVTAVPDVDSLQNPMFSSKP